MHTVFETPVVSKDGNVVDSVPDRNMFYTAQAPQCFFLGEILEAHLLTRDKNPSYNGIIDSCTLMKSLGKEVSIVKGNRG